jgi:hypothetical protein
MSAACADLCGLQMAEHCVHQRCLVRSETVTALVIYNFRTHDNVKLRSQLATLPLAI